MIFNAPQHDVFSEHYPDRTVKLKHNLAADQRFEIAALLELAKSLPPDNIEYNAGDLPLEQDPAKTPMNGLSVEETLNRIEEHQSWMVLKNVEQATAFKTLLDECIDELEDVLKPRTGAAEKREGFIFISSPGSITPFHMDPEHNILLQLRGLKTMRVFPHRDLNIVSPKQHEEFHGASGHRNLKYDDSFAAKEVRHDLAPGEAVYVPVKAPHWVENGPDVSVSFSITWRSNQSDFDARLHRANAWLRAQGKTPPAPGASGFRDRTAVLTHRIVQRFSN